MTILQSIILGIIQGLTEFIPVSSTAHLLISQHLLGLAATRELFIFTVLVQQGTLIALIVFYWSDIWEIGRAWLRDIWHGFFLRDSKPFTNPHARLGWYLILGSVPAALAGLLLKDQVEALFRTPLVEALIRLLITIVLLLTAEYIGKRNRKLENMNWLDALWVGVMQVLAVFPGASRSGSTIAGGMIRGFDRPAAARFAFLLSVPVFLAAGFYETVDLIRHYHLSSNILPSILTGMLTAAVVGYLAIRWLLAYLAKRPLYSFVVYCAIITLGIAILLVI